MSDSLMHHYNPMLLPSVSLQLLTYWLAILPNIQASYPSVLGWNSELSYLFTVSTPFNPNLFIFSISSTSWARGALSSALSAENAFDAESYVCRICGFWVAFNMLRRSRWKLSYTYRFEPFKAIGIALESHLISSNRFTNTLTILSFYCMQWKPFGYRYRLLPVSFVEGEVQGYLENVHSDELLTGRWQSWCPFDSVLRVLQAQ